MPHVGVCSWSLRSPTLRDLARDVLSCGVDAIQLALDPIRSGDWDLTQVQKSLADNHISLLSGMMGTKGEDYSTLETIRATGGVRLNQYWDENLAAAHANAELAVKLGIQLITLHAGFLPHDPRDPLRVTMIERLRRIIGAFATKGIAVAFETGQEDAETLLSVLHDLRAERPGVNFDPANIVLYAMGDPIPALRQLAPHILQVHIKDANPPAHPGEWGQEVVVGAGSVDWHAFFNTLAELKPTTNLVIEREAGDSRIADIKAARKLIMQIGGL